MHYSHPVRDNIVFILVRPVFLGNMGSAARALKNFGFSNLRLVQPPRNYRDSEARRMSVGAFDVLKQARLFDTVSDALKDINLAVGTTSGRQRENAPVALPGISERIVSAAMINKVGVLFGDERDGLSRAELDRCHHVITIPTAADFPALNVAQAVAIVAYELTRPPSTNPPPAERYSSGENDDRLFTMLDQILDAAGFSRKFNRASVLAELREFYQRALPTAREADLLDGALRRIRQKLSG